MKRLFLLMILTALVCSSCRKSAGAVGDESDIVSETNLAIGNLIRVPEPGKTPQKILSTAQYDGTIEWFIRVINKNTVTVINEDTGEQEEIEEEVEEEVAFEGATFEEKTTYIAKVELRAINGYTFDGIAANAFKHSKAKSISNPANSGNVRITFVTMPLPADLKTTFEITSSDEQGIEELFVSLHTYLNDPSSDLIGDEKIYLGDYFDLPFLTVSNYPVGTPDAGGFALTADQDAPRTHKKLRIIVVGLNTFMGKNDNPATRQHIVFQFQNIPVSRYMGSKFPDDTGYLNSEIQDYLLDPDNRISFLEGLETAGVKADYLMEVKRKVISRINSDPEDLVEIQDKLWLPSEWEMFGKRKNSSGTFENSANQAVLAYYNVNDANIAKTNRIKYKDDDHPHWYSLSSTNDVGDNVSRFCSVSLGGDSQSNPYNDGGGIVPAFVLF